MSPFDITLGLLTNLVTGTLSITLINLIRAAFWKRNQIIPRWLLGILFAGAAFVGLLYPVTYSPGVLRDFRNILVAMAACYGGAQAGIVAAIIAGTYRLYLGGGGALGGILGLFCAALVGVIFYRQSNVRAMRTDFWRLLGLGMAVFAITFGWSWTLPRQQVWQAIQTFFVPELILYPLVTLLFGMLYQLESDRQTSLERFRAVFKESQLGILLLSIPKYFIMEVNQAFLAILGYSRTEMVGLRLADILHSDQLPEFLRQKREAPILEPKKIKLELSFMKKTGEMAWLNIAITELQDQDGQVRYGMAVAEDITGRKLAAEELQQYLRRLKILHKTDQAILKAHSTEKTIQESLHNIREMVPCQRSSVMLFDFDTRQARVMIAEVSGDSLIKEGAVVSLNDIISIEKLKKGDTVLFDNLSEAHRAEGILNTLRDEGILSFVMIPLVVHDNLIGTLNLGASVQSAFNKSRIEIATEVASSLAVAIQNTRLMEEIMLQQQELKKMSALILQAQESERKRISVELHDEMGQELTGISISLGVIEKLMPAGLDPSIKARIAETRRMADLASDQIRDLSFHLRPSILDDLGLVPTLRWYVRQYADRMNLEVDLKTEYCEMSITPEIKTLLYRVVQESLNNVAKHAAARKVVIRLERDKNMAVLVIEDDGKGFAVNRYVNPGTAKHGLGLIGMRERVEFAGGNFMIRSTPGHGTHLVVEVPMGTGEGR
jgi:PAS domain S-box-containing protein